MAFFDNAITITRAMLGDLGPTAEYSDERLEELLIVASHFVNQEMDFTNTYTIDLEALSIDPDPTLAATQEDDFVNFVVLRALCFLDIADMKIKLRVSGVKVECGPARLETLGVTDAFETLLDKGFCALYNQLKKEHKFAGGASRIRAVMSPFVGNNFWPLDIKNRHSNRDRSFL